MLNKRAAGSRRTSHTTFTVERLYDATPARVFAAWSTPELKARWFVGPASWQTRERALDFREGGSEILVGVFDTGQVSRFESRYHEVVPDQRIIYSYVMSQDDKRISVSLATVELAAEGDRTRLRFTEQAVFLDDFDDGGGRERGTTILLEQLGASLASR